MINTEILITIETATDKCYEALDQFLYDIELPFKHGYHPSLDDMHLFGDESDI